MHHRAWGKRKGQKTAICCDVFMMMNGTAVAQELHGGGGTAMGNTWPPAVQLVVVASSMAKSCGSHAACPDVPLLTCRQAKAP